MISYFIILEPSGTILAKKHDLKQIILLHNRRVYSQIILLGGAGTRFQIKNTNPITSIGRLGEPGASQCKVKYTVRCLGSCMYNTGQVDIDFKGIILLIVFEKKYILRIKTTHFPYEIRSRLVPILQMTLYILKSTLKLRSALHFSYSIVILCFITYR